MWSEITFWLPAFCRCCANLQFKAVWLKYLPASHLHLIYIFIIRFFRTFFIASTYSAQSFKVFFFLSQWELGKKKEGRHFSRKLNLLFFFLLIVEWFSSGWTNHNICNPESDQFFTFHNFIVVSFQHLELFCCFEDIIHVFIWMRLRQLIASR